MPVPPMFVCANIFQAKTLAEHNCGNALFDVADKTALITGGGSGIGAFMATALSDAGGPMSAGWTAAGQACGHAWPARGQRICH